MALNIPAYGARSPYLNPFLEDDEDEYTKAMKAALRGENASPEDLAYYAAGAPARYDQRKAIREMFQAPPDGESVGAAKSRIAMGRDLMATAPETLTQVGRISAANPWKAAASGLQKGVGAYLLASGGKALSEAEKAEAAREAAKEEAALKLTLAKEQEAEAQKRAGIQLANEREDRLIRDANIREDTIRFEENEARKKERQQDRDYIERVDPDTGRVFNYRQGDEVPENYMSVDAYEALYDNDSAGLIDSDARFTPETQDAIAGLATGGERTKARTALVALEEMNEAMQMVQQVTAEGGDFTGGWGTILPSAAETIGGLFGENAARGARNMAKDAYYTEEEQGVRGKISRAVAAFKRSESGANLTNIERELGEDWDPQEAQSEEEALRRLYALSNYMNRTLSVYGIPEQQVYDPAMFDQTPIQVGNGPVAEETAAPITQKPPGMSQADWDRLQELEAKRGGRR